MSQLQVQRIRKFVFFAFHADSDAELLVLADQHAVSERIKLEELEKGNH